MVMRCTDFEQRMAVAFRLVVVDRDLACLPVVVDRDMACLPVVEVDENSNPLDVLAFPPDDCLVALVELVPPFSLVAVYSVD